MRQRSSGTAGIAGNGNGASAGGVGNWDTTITNWDAGAEPYVAWNNGNLDTASFGGTAGIVTLTAPIIVGGLTFSHTTGTYTLQTGTLTLAAGAIIKATAGGGTASLATMTSADNIFRFQNTVTTNNFANSTLFTMSSALGGASNSVQILGNGASVAAPVVVSGTLTYGGGTTVADKAAIGFSTANVTGLGAGSVSLGQNTTVLRTGGSLNNAFLTRLAATTNPLTIIGNNAGSNNALDLSGTNGGVNLPNASLAFWDNVGTQSFAFTQAITAGSNGYLFGSTRAANNINITTTANVLSGTASLATIAGCLGNLIITNANNFTGNTINNTTAAGKTITIGNNLAIQNSAIDTSGAGTYTLTVTTPTVGGLIGSKQITATSGSFVFVNAGYLLLTSLTVNPGNGVTNTYSGVIANSTGGLAITKSGLGTQVLSGLNSFTGNVLVSGGTLAANSSTTVSTGGSTALGTSSSGRTITVNSGATLRFDTGNVFSNNFSQSAVPSLTIAGTATNNVAGNNALGNVTLNSGTLTATNGHATYGAFNINGTITSTGTSFISTSDPVNGRMILISSGANNVPTDSTIDVTGTLTISAPLADLLAAESKISGILKTNTGTLVLTGTNTYTGKTTISAGTLQLGDGTAGNDGTITMTSEITSNGTLIFNSFGNLSAPAAITGSGAVRKVGPGMQTLSNASSYAGSTTVSGGTLEVTGSLTGTTTVQANAGGTLQLNNAGANAVNANATFIGNGGTLAVADGTSNQAHTFGTLSLIAGSSFNFGLGNVGNALGFGTVAPATVTALNTPTLTLNISNWNGTPYAPGSGFSNGDPAQSHLFVGTTDQFGGTGVLIPGIAFAGIGSGIQVFNTGRSQFEIVPVPEPATTVLIGSMALCALLGCRERRRFVSHATTR